MDLAFVSHLLETGDKQINDLHISLSNSGHLCDAHFQLSPEELSMELPFHFLSTLYGVPW